MFFERYQFSLAWSKFRQACITWEGASRDEIGYLQGWPVGFVDLRILIPHSFAQSD